MDLYHPAFACHRSYYEWAVWNYKPRDYPEATGDVYMRALSYGLRPEFAYEFAYN